MVWPRLMIVLQTLLWLVLRQSVYLSRQGEEEDHLEKKAFVFAPAVTINIPSFFTPTFSSTPSFPHFFEALKKSLVFLYLQKDCNFAIVLCDSEREKKSNLTYDPVSPVAFTQFYCKEKRSARNRDLLTLESEEDYESLINYSFLRHQQSHLFPRRNLENHFCFPSLCSIRCQKGCKMPHLVVVELA